MLWIDQYRSAKYSFFDDFNRSNGGLGSNWAHSGGGDVAISSNAVVVSGPGRLGTWVTPIPSVDQWAEMDVVSSSGSNNVGLTLRKDDPDATETFHYMLRYNPASGGQWEIFRKPLGAYVSLATATTPDVTPTYRIRFEVWTNGSNNVELRGYNVVGGVPSLTISFTDSSGSRRLGGDYVGFRGSGTTTIDNYAGGEL